MTHREEFKANLRVEFTKAALNGIIRSMEYVNFVEPATIVAEKAWKIGDALAEMEMKHRKEQSSGSKDPKA